jgi:uncharacterized protein YggE
MVKDINANWIALGILGIIMLAGFYFIATQIVPPEINVSTYPETHAIYTSGTSSTKVDPDLLLITLGVETKETTASSSQSSNAQIMDAVKTAIKNQGLLDSDIQTTQFSVQPVQEKINDKYVITGYRTIHMVTLNIENLDNGGKILDAASNAGANRIDSISFTLKQATRRSLQEQQLGIAAADAKTRALKIASSLGEEIDGVVSASENFYYSPTVRSYDAAYELAAPSAKTDLSSGQIEVGATVSVSFEVKE